MTTTSHEVLVAPHRFWVTRSGSGTPIVLIHGLGGSSDWWRRNVEILAARHTVAAVDLVGFGRNRFFLRRSRLPLVFDEISSVLARWMATELGQPVHLVGNSMGGQIAIHLAASRPDLVRSLTLVDSTGIPFGLDARAHLENIVVPRGLLSFTTVLARDLLRAGPTSLAVAFARLLTDDARPLMRTLRMPVLLIWGEDDPLVPPAYAERMREEISHARLVLIPRAGHIPMWENPSAFNTALLEFVEEVEGGDGQSSGRGAFTWGIAGWHEGIAHRAAGRGRDIVLVHGLGMSSAYLVRVGRSLFDRGWSPVAPDLLGFGESGNAVAAAPEEHAQWLIEWADAIGIRNAVWVGHSTGCNVVAHVGSARPDLVRHAFFIGPLWTASAHPSLRAVGCLIADAFREPLSLFSFVLRAYWRTGLARWLGTWRRHVPDLAAPRLPRAVTAMGGQRDPLPDRPAMKQCGHWIDLPGAHAALFSHPEETAEAIGTAVPMRKPAVSPGLSLRAGGTPEG